MKIAVTSSGKSPDSNLDSRFGRAAVFMVFDTRTGVFEPCDNTQSADAGTGAGIQAAETIAGLGVEKLVTGHVGPKAFKALTCAGIEIYTAGTLTVSEAVEELLAGRLVKAASPDVEGHWV